MNEAVCDSPGFWLLKKKLTKEKGALAGPIPLIKKTGILRFSERRDLHVVFADEVVKHLRPAEQLWLFEGFSASCTPGGRTLPVQTFCRTFSRPPRL